MRDANSSQAKPCIVAIVDDDRAMREGLMGFVRSLDYEAVAYASAEQFLDAAAPQELCCLITDLQMQGMNGVELQTRLLATHPALPVIFITAFPDSHLMRQALRPGAAAVLSKPFDTDELVRCLRTACGRPEEN